MVEATKKEKDAIQESFTPGGRQDRERQATSVHSDDDLDVGP
jgi:hypothetical protein